MAEEPRRTIYQPIHPSILSRLDPEYIAFHEQYLQYVPPSESLPWDPACRTESSPSAAGCSEPVPIHSIRDIPYDTHSQQQLRIFTAKPEDDPKRPSAGWPVLVWFHGGGWTMGGLASENSFLTRVCRDVGCVVVSVNYRHAPEEPYPAAIDDAVEGYRWVISETGQKELGIDPNKIAVGGLSAGGGLAAILSLKAAHLDFPPPQFQLLILPVIDNTARASTVWSQNAHAPWLTPSRMIWYRRMYMPNESSWSNWDASPNLAPKELLERCPKTLIAVAECDILCAEGRDFGELLREKGVEVEVKVYEGCTHSLLILDGVLAKGRQLVKDATGALAKAFGSS